MKILLVGLPLVFLAGAVLSTWRRSTLAALVSPVAIPALLLIVLELAWLVDPASIGCFDGVETCRQADSVLFMALVWGSLYWTVGFVSGITVGRFVRERVRATKGIV